MQKIETLKNKLGERFYPLTSTKAVVDENGNTIEYRLVVADGEDLVTDGNVLRLKDRPNTDGMGYVILRKDKTFAEQVTKPNTIYEIRYDFDLNGAEIAIPENCVLKFEGGMLRNGTVVGDTTFLEASLYCIFANTCLDGTFSNNTLYAEWFGAKANDKSKAVENVAAINAACRCAASTTTFDSINSVTLSKGRYYIDGSIELPMSFMYFGGEEMNDTGNSAAYPIIHQLANAPIIKLVSRNNVNGTYLNNFRKTTIKNLCFESAKKEDFSNTYGIYGDDLSGISCRIENIVMNEGSFVHCGVYLELADTKAGLMESQFCNISLMKCDIGIYIGGKTNNWMNGNSFEKIVCTSCRLWGIVIGPMLGQSMNNFIKDSFFEECGLDYNYTDYVEHGAGGIKLFHTSMCIENCYFEANFAARHSSTGILNPGESIFNGPIGENGNEEHIEPTELSIYEAGIFCQGGTVVVSNCSFAAAHRTISVYQNKCILEIKNTRPTLRELNGKTSKSLVNYIPNSTGGLDGIHLKFNLLGGQSQWNLSSVYEILGAVSRDLISESHIDILAVDGLGIKQCEEYVNYGKYREGTVFYVSNENGNDLNAGTNERSAFKSLSAFYNSKREFPETIVIKLLDNINATTSLRFNPSIKNISFKAADGVVTMSNSGNLFNFNKNLRLEKISFKGLNITASSYFCILEDAIYVKSEFIDCNITINSRAFIYGTDGCINATFDNCTFDADTTSRWISLPNNCGIIHTSLSSCTNPKNLRVWNTYAVKGMTGGKSYLPVYNNDYKIMGFWDNEDLDPTQSMYNLDYTNSQRVRIVKGERISTISFEEVKEIFNTPAKAYVVVQDITIPSGETLDVQSGSALILKGGVIKGAGVLRLNNNKVTTLDGTLNDIRCDIIGNFSHVQLRFDTTLNKPLFYTGIEWIEADGSSAGVQRAGTWSQRPNADGSFLENGFQYFLLESEPDEDPDGNPMESITGNGKPIWWIQDSGKWVDSTGATVTG